jgi:GNAT superfamily N-acetyltransferase
VTLRFDQVCEGDAETLVGLARDFHQEDGHPLTEAGEKALRAIARGEPFARAWLVREQEAALGYLIITLGFSVEYGGRDGFIDDLYLVPAARGRGLGRTVIGFATAQAREAWHRHAAPGGGKRERCGHAALSSCRLRGNRQEVDASASAVMG